MPAQAAPTNSLSLSSDQFDRLLLGVTDAALGGVVFAVPLVMGGRHPVGELLYIACTMVAAAAWCLRQSRAARAAWNFSGVEWLLVAGVVLLALQMACLPVNWVASLTGLPKTLLPLWSGGPANAAFPAWPYVSMMPQATRAALVLFSTHCVLFLTLLQRLQTLEDIQRLLRWLAVATVGMAIIGLGQLLAGNGKYLWIYAYPYDSTDRVLKGTFGNQNHVAHFLALGLGPLIWWASQLAAPPVAANSGPRKRRAPRDTSATRNTFGHPQSNPMTDFARWAGLLSIVIVVFAALSTYSRGGVLMILLALAVCVGMLVWLRALGKMSLAGLGAATVIVIAAITIFGYHKLSEELATVGAGSLDELDPSQARRNLWAADLQAFTYSPWLGTGAGSHAEVYRTFFSQFCRVEFTYAESSWVQVIMETGSAGAAIAFLLWAFALWWVISALRRTASRELKLCLAAVLPGLVITGIHSIWDFVWYIPACLTVTIILAACACRICSLSLAERRASTSEEQTPATAGMPSFAWATLSIAIAGIGVVLAGTRIGPVLATPAWERYVVLRRAEAGSESQATPSALMACLQETLKRDPNNARARLHMALLCLRRFDEEQASSENPMPLAQLRDAAATSKFETLEQQNAWLTAVMGENKLWLDAAMAHAQASLTLCPLQGEAYTVLAELSFLNGPSTIGPDTLVKQALCVRPYDADVLYVAGRDAALAGDTDQTIQYWKLAFQRDPRNRAQIIAILAPHVPAEKLLAQFAPDIAGTRELYKYYKLTENAEAGEVVTRRLVVQVEEELAAGQAAAPVRSWQEAHDLYRVLGDQQAALRCIEQAVALAPFEYQTHRRLAICLIHGGDFERALTELRWCRQRQPDDSELARLQQVAQDGKLAEVQNFESAAEPFESAGEPVEPPR